MFRTTPFKAMIVASLLVTALAPAPAVHAGQGDCGQPSSTGDSPTATDALTALRAAVSLAQCLLSVCDVDGTGSITASDALIILKVAVGQSIMLGCPAEMPMWPADPADYTPGPVSYLDTLAIPAVDPGPPAVAECCKDFGDISRDFIVSGTNNIDNALAVLASQLLGLGIDFGQILDDSIVSGDLLILFDHQLLQFNGGMFAGVGARSLPDEFALAQLAGTFDAGTTYDDAAAGNGEFLISRSSFEPGTGEPSNFAHPALMDTTSLSAGPFTLEIKIPFGFLSLDLVAEAAEVTADHGPISDAGIDYTNGEISGYVPVDDIFAALNEILNSSQCDCLGLAEDVFQQNASGVWTSGMRCLADAATVCALEDEAVCATLAGSDFAADPPQVCVVLPGLMAGIADINLDEDTNDFEAMSLGLQFTGVPAQVNGVEPAGP